MLMFHRNEGVDFYSEVNKNRDFTLKAQRFSLMFFAASNPFIEAYVQSDLFGKAIFISLLLLSVISWVVLLFKIKQNRRWHESCSEFYDEFQDAKTNPLSLDCEPYANERGENPYLSIYLSLKKCTLDLLHKNKRASKQNTFEGDDAPSYLSANDVDFVASRLDQVVATESKILEKYLFVLATIITLAPFLGLLGTVWGILVYFGEMQTSTEVGNNQAIIGGLSLALTTTVIGLLDAIPALIGYNYLKQKLKEFEIDMDTFANEALATIEIQYRKVELN
jgi:biopolymer transport protein TolQ